MSLPVPKNHETAKGNVKAVQFTSKTVSNQSYRDILGEFNRFTSDEARAAFAKTWIFKASLALDETWPVLYELLRLVQERKLFLRDDPISKTPGYPDFKSFFEATLKKPFTQWAELESTYHFVNANCPEVLGKPYTEARKTLAARAAEVKPLANHGEFGRGRKRDDNGMPISRGSNSSEYLLARIKRDRPDLIPEIGEGKKYPSVRSAAQAAGIAVGNRQVYMSSDPSIAAKKLLSSFDAAYIDELVLEIGKQRDTTNNIKESKQ